MMSRAFPAMKVNQNTLETDKLFPGTIGRSVATVTRSVLGISVLISHTSAQYLYHMVPGYIVPLT